MNKPILEAEEVHALLSAVAPEEQEKALFATLPPIPQPKKVDVFEFSETQGIGVDQHPMFSHLHNRTVEIFSEWWGSVFHREVTVFFKELVDKSYIEALDSDEPRAYFTLECTGHGTILVVLDMALVVSYIDAMLGGTGEVVPEEGKTLTLVELRLAERIAESASNILAKLWKPLRSMDFNLRRIDTDPTSLAMTADDVSCFSVSHVIVLGEEVRGDITLHYPLPFLEPMLMSMRVQAREQSASTDTNWNRTLLSAVDHFPLTLRLELGRCHLLVRDFLQLKPDDLLPMILPEDETSTVWVEKHQMFYALPGQQQGMLAAEILDPINIGGKT